MLGITTMLIRTASFWKNRNALKTSMLDIAIMAKQCDISWKNQLKLSQVLVFSEVAIFFTCDFLTIIFTETSNIYLFFTYATPFLVGFTENWFHFEVQSAIRRIFCTINSKVQQQVKNKSKEKSISNITRCAKDHFVMVQIAKRINEIFGVVMASWFGLNFLHLTDMLHYCWVCWNRLLASGNFVPEAFTSTIWIVLVMANLVFLIGSWQRTSEEVSNQLMIIVVLQQNLSKSNSLQH